MANLSATHEIDSGRESRYLTTARAKISACGHYLRIGRPAASGVDVDRAGDTGLARSKVFAGDRITRQLACVSIVTTVYFIAAAVGVHFVDQRYDPVRDYMSDYVLGPGGQLFAVAIYVTALGTLALAAGLWRVMLPPARPAGGIVLIALFAVAYAIVGTFPTDIMKPGALPTTTFGILHVSGATIGWIAFPLGAFLIARAFPNFPALAGAKPAAMLLSWLMMAALLAFAVVESLALPVVGLAEKTFIAFRQLWLLVVGFVLLRAGR